MFTGIVEEIGTVHRMAVGDGAARLEVGCSLVLDGTNLGDSLNTNGCCLTVTGLSGGAFSADLMGETLARTALGRLRPGSGVNLERAVRADARLGGHLVQGHVDAVCEVVEVTAHPQWTQMRFSLPAAVASYVVSKGSVAVDGTSLTVSDVGTDTFAVGLIPHTLAATVLGRHNPGDEVNLEVDVIAKYVERMLKAGASTPYSQPAPLSASSPTASPPPAS